MEQTKHIESEKRDKRIFGRFQGRRSRKIRE
jgi:hypothetical protein